MALAVSASPTYPAAGDEVTLTLTGATALETVYEFELTSVPSASALSAGKLVDAFGVAISTFTPDVAGSYGITGYAYTFYSGGSAPYENSPTGEVRRRLTSSATASVAAGTAMILPIVTKRGEGATLRLVSVDTTVRDASLVAPLSELSRVAALDSTVVAALAAMVGVAVAALDVDLATDVRNMQAAYLGHRTGSSSWHSQADTVNVITHGAPYSVDDSVVALNELYDRIVAHEAATGDVHTNADTKNVPVTAKASALGSAIVTKADLRERCYERHRVMGNSGTPAVHLNAGGDTTYAMAAPLQLPAFISVFLDVLSAASQTPPTGEASGAIVLQHALGFTIQ